jgi:hypothetical protein
MNLTTPSLTLSNINKPTQPPAMNTKTANPTKKTANNITEAPCLTLSPEVTSIIAKEAELDALVTKFGHEAASREKKRLKLVAEGADSSIADQEAWLDASEGKLEARWYTTRAMHKTRLDAFRLKSWPIIRKVIQKRYEANSERKKAFMQELSEFQSRWNITLDIPDPFRAVMYDDECRLKWSEGMHITEPFSRMLS